MCHTVGACVICLLIVCVCLFQFLFLFFFKICYIYMKLQVYMHGTRGCLVGALRVRVSFPLAVHVLDLFVWFFVLFEILYYIVELFSFYAFLSIYY
jgi:hypothetical protein